MAWPVAFSNLIAAWATVGQLSDQAKAIGAVTGSQRGAADALTQFAASGKVGADSLQQFAQYGRLARLWEQYSSQNAARSLFNISRLLGQPDSRLVKRHLTLFHQI